MHDRLLELHAADEPRVRRRELQARPVRLAQRVNRGRKALLVARQHVQSLVGCIEDEVIALRHPLLGFGRERELKGDAVAPHELLDRHVEVHVACLRVENEWNRRAVRKAPARSNNSNN